MSGLVSLVGAGPGAPDLLTLRAVERLRCADAVVVDRLVHADALGWCQAGVEQYLVGKAPGAASARQSEINALLVELGMSGRRVVRLKGGDPFVFGRGGEEMLALAAAGVRFEVVPGVSAALAAPAAVGIPVTHRGLARGFSVATASSESGDAASDLAWVAGVRGTLVLLMVVHTLDATVHALMRHGRCADEPAALIAHATLDSQSAVFAPLGQLADRAVRARLAPPATLVVGPTVALAARTGSREQVFAHADQSAVARS